MWWAAREYTMIPNNTFGHMQITKWRSLPSTFCSSLELSSYSFISDFLDLRCPLLMPFSRGIFCLGAHLSLYAHWLSAELETKCVSKIWWLPGQKSRTLCSITHPVVQAVLRCDVNALKHDIIVITTASKIRTPAARQVLRMFT